MDALRSTLKPLTHTLPSPIRDLGLTLIGPECYNTLILDIDPAASPECVKLAISKGLGIGIVGAASVVKIPQLVKLLRSRSASGISFLSYALETTSFLISLAYNVRQGFPFSTYGETALIAIQNVAIATAVLHFSGQDAGAATFVAILAVSCYALFSKGIVDMTMLSVLQAGAGVLGVASKAPQIWTVYKEGGTGQLSAFAVFNYLLGSLSRIFTTLQEVDDALILYGFVAGFTLNAVLAAQMVYYWNSPPEKKTTRKRAKKQTKPVAASTSGMQTRSKTPSTRRRG
ncbi:putative monosaccharide-P-dolichol utilization protein [Lineolata rhizophorae]|uniref:Mannose-P-dolichol utilization defect 1 protein homolog n=1 Tax=Lineolata rhizophorae TaxID=578093 RepID=A0A6A6NSQ7_9PEZI|nr:putative monosaccharide-P-dolichol utilization protein [Lineolata rhizophorae]